MLDQRRMTVIACAACHGCIHETQMARSFTGGRAVVHGVRTRRIGLPVFFSSRVTAPAASARGM